MIRYVRQQDAYRCGPISILNALKWAGRDVTYKKDLARISRSCKCIYPNGTTRGCFDRCLRIEGRGHLGIVKKMSFSIRDIDNHLEDGGAALINHAWRDESGDLSGHYCLLSRIIVGSPPYYEAINEARKITGLIADRGYILNIIRRRKSWRTQFPVALANAAN